MAKNQVTLTFAGDDKSLQRTLTSVGKGTKAMATQATTGISKFGMASRNAGKTAKGLQGALAGLVATGGGVKAMMEGDIIGGLLQLEGGFGKAAMGAAKFAVTAGKAIASFSVSTAKAVAQFVADSARVVAGWIAMGIKSMINAAKMAAAWLISLGPVGLVIAAIGAVIGILALCGVSFDDVKKAAGKVWNWIRGHWPLLLAILTGPFGLATLFIIRNRDKIVAFLRSGFAAIKGFASGAASWIIDKFQRVVSFFAGLPRMIGGIFAKVGSGIASGIKAVWNRTVGGFGFTIPKWVPGLGGKSFRIPKLHMGGIMPGAPGTEGLALLQAGERVSKAGASTGAVIHVHVAGSIRSDRELIRIIRDEFDRGGFGGRGGGVIR
jgi:hypothetical protein